jgi:hypothetical protein
MILWRNNLRQLREKTMMTKSWHFSIECAILTFLFLSGCVSQKKASAEMYAAVQGGRYQISLERQTFVNLSISDGQTSTPQKMTENLDMVMTCQSLGQIADGSTSYRISFESIQARKTDFIQTGRFTDSAAGLSGKSFNVMVTPTGMVISPQLQQELKNLSANSFDEVKRSGARLKNPDFLADTWCIQALVFEAAAASKSAAKTLSFKATCQLPFPIADIPGPVIQTSWQPEKAVGGVVLKGKEQLNEGITQNPMPSIYSGQYKMEGLLGYLRQCNYESVEGQIVCRFGHNMTLPAEIQLERTIKASADYILTQNNPHSEITVKELLKITAIK